MFRLYVHIVILGVLIDTTHVVRIFVIHYSEVILVLLFKESRFALVILRHVCCVDELLATTSNHANTNLRVGLAAPLRLESITAFYRQSCWVEVEG